MLAHTLGGNFEYSNQKFKCFEWDGIAVSTN